MKIVRLVKNSDFKNVEHLVKYSGKGMTTMPKTPQEIKERISGQKGLEIKKRINLIKTAICLFLKTTAES